MTEDELTLALRHDKDSGLASEVILADGAETRIRSYDRSRQVVICERGREVSLFRLERSGSIFFEKASGGRSGVVANLKGR